MNPVNRYKSNLGLILYFILIVVPFMHCSNETETLVVTKSNLTPAWLKHPATPVVKGGSNQEPLIFRRRRGGVPTNAEEIFLESHTLNAIEKCKRLGGNFYMLHLYKGFGLEAEREEIELTKEFGKLCHENGLKIGTYVGSTIAYETLLIENPEAEEWLVDDYLGEPVIYGGTQYFRRRPYFMHPGYKKFIKRVLKTAVEEVHSDFIHFDNPANQGVTAVFSHPLAIQDFHKYLKHKYSPDKLKERLGFSNVDHILPPRYVAPERFEAFDDPVTQEWIDFRCQQLADYYKEMSAYIRRLNPETAVQVNPHGITGVNRAWESSVDFSRLLSHTDVYVLEDQNQPGVTEDNVLVNNIRSFKIGRTMHNIVMNGMKHYPLSLAESFAFNMNWVPYTNEDVKHYVKFYIDNFSHYRETTNIADVAVLRSFPSMAYNNYATHQSTVLFEQALIQAKIPFDIIFEDDLKDLSKYSVLILANQECISDEQLNQIREFVREGGGLVFTEQSTLFDEWRRRRPALGLGDLLARESSQQSVSNHEKSRTDNEERIVKNQFGNGRIVYLPKIIASKKRPENQPMKNAYWKLPINWKEMVDAVTWALDNKLSLETAAPLTVVMELTEQEDQNKIMLHMINYKKNSRETNIKVSCHIADRKRVKGVRLLSPDRPGLNILKFQFLEERLSFTVPKLEIYNLVVIDFE